MKRLMDDSTPSLQSISGNYLVVLGAEFPIHCKNIFTRKDGYVRKKVLALLGRMTTFSV